MLKLSIFIASFIFSLTSYAQYNYEVSNENPFGLPNPDAPAEIKDFESMIGECSCISTSRAPDGTWKDPVKMTWRFKYIMNGYAVQDETLKEDGAHSGSIRQFHEDENKWFVHYYSSATPSKALSIWEGGKENGKIVLSRDQKAPNGVDGFFRLTFYDMDNFGYKWIGEWVDKTKTTIYPTWKIECLKNN
ncbi:hypothetical protein BC962_1709 [Gillisia mitskevichiae]|uniref:Uncharacterized protein n=1 Tax=Gillisia mitskevichiae TaxID=270921 RepID=A0A495PVG1_9FLAO|nr:hypothetical protein [Gillisia mitskevichiae]RKS53458.1 hypothetical protein BC962_1709 [Gillisia mitskevichiae]